MWRVGRIAAGIACMLLSAGAVYVYKNGEFPFEILSAFLLSFVAWAFAEYKSDATNDNANTGLHPHDVELGNALRAILSERLKRYLKSHPVSSTFIIASFDPVSQLSNWNGPEREFENCELDNLSFEVVRLSRELDGQISEHSNLLEHNLDFASFAPDHERISDWHSRETSIKIQEANSIATQLAEAGDNFERAFRRLSPESYRS